MRSCRHLIARMSTKQSLTTPLLRFTALTQFMQNHSSSYGLTKMNKFAFSQYNRRNEEFDTMERDNMSEKEYSEAMEKELKPYLHSFEQMHSSSPNEVPDIKSLQENLMGFENSYEYTGERITELLVGASWVSMR